MSDRWVFLAAFLTAVLVVAGVFAIPQFFVYELLTSTIFIVVAVMVFFGDDKFPYMLGMVAPILWYIFTVLTGEFFGNLGVLFRFFAGRAMRPLDTPLHGFSILASVLLIAVSAYAWRKQVTEKFFGSSFAKALVVALVWIALMAVWQFHMISAGVRAQ